jgi:hypothetical protein
MVTVFGSFLDEGVTQYFTNSVLREQGLAEGKVPHLKDKLRCAKELVRLFRSQPCRKSLFPRGVSGTSQGSCPESQYQFGTTN